MDSYKLIRSKRKTISVQVLEDGSLLVRAPLGVPRVLIDNFILKKKKTLDRFRDQILAMPPVPAITKVELQDLKKQAKIKILPRVEELSAQTGLHYQGAKITVARQRFGSCNAQNHLCFSAFLCLADEKEIDYVIVHELCHTIEHNHSHRFYNLVSEFMPDWKARETTLKKIVIPRIAE